MAGRCCSRTKITRSSTWLILLSTLYPIKTKIGIEYYANERISGVSITSLLTGLVEIVVAVHFKYKFVDKSTVCDLCEDELSN